MTDYIGLSSLSINEPLAAAKMNFTNYPNPFRGTTTLAYTLPADGKVIIEVSNMLGSKMELLVDEVQSAGNHTLTLNTNGWGPGVYTATLRLINTKAILTRSIKIIRHQ